MCQIFALTWELYSIYGDSPFKNKRKSGGCWLTDSLNRLIPNSWSHPSDIRGLHYATWKSKSSRRAVTTPSDRTSDTKTGARGARGFLPGPTEDRRLGQGPISRPGIQNKPHDRLFPSFSWGRHLTQLGLGSGACEGWAHRLGQDHTQLVGHPGEMLPVPGPSKGDADHTQLGVLGQRFPVTGLRKGDAEYSELRHTCFMNKGQCPL